MRFPAVDTGALKGGAVPLVGRYQIIRPERPGPALIRPNGINSTAPFVVGIGQKNAVPGYRLLDDGRSLTNTLDIFAPQLLSRFIYILCNKGNLSLSNPDITLIWPGATRPTLQTLKMQTPNIPLGFVFVIRHGFTQIHSVSLDFGKCFYHFSIAPVSAEVAIEAYLAR